MNMSSLHRRDFLSQMATGLGGIALASLLPDCSLAAPAAAHFPPKAKRVIQLFMNGGASQCDLFDYKPELIARHGKPFDPGGGQIKLVQIGAAADRQQQVGALKRAGGAINFGLNRERPDRAGNAFDLGAFMDRDAFGGEALLYDAGQFRIVITKRL